MIDNGLKTFLQDTVGIDVDALKEALTSDEEVKIEFKSGTFLDDDKLTELKNTVKKEGYNEGKVAGVEIEAKRVKEKFGIDIEGKNFDNIFEAHGKTVLEQAKIEPNKKVQELTKSLDNLRTQYENDLRQKNEEVTQLNSKLGSFKIDSELSKHIPNGLKGIKPNQFKVLAKANYEFDFDGDNFVAKKNGEVLKDKLEQPIDVKNLMADFATQNEWLTPDGGRGGTDTRGNGSKFETQKELFDYMKENNIDHYSEEGSKLLDDFIKQNN